MGVVRPPPLGILAEGGLRGVDIGRGLNETPQVDDGEVQLEQPGPWSAAFPLFFAMPEAAFFPKCREGQGPHVRSLTYSMWPWFHGCSCAATSPGGLDRRQFGSPKCLKARGFRSASLSQDLSTCGHRENRPRHCPRGQRARSRSVSIARKL